MCPIDFSHRGTHAYRCTHIQRQTISFERCNQLLFILMPIVSAYECVCVCFKNFNRTVSKLNNTYTQYGYFCSLPLSLSSRLSTSVNLGETLYSLILSSHPVFCLLPLLLLFVWLCVHMCTLCYFIGSIIRLAGRPLIAPGTDQTVVRVVRALCIDNQC